MVYYVPRFEINGIDTTLVSLHLSNPIVNSVFEQQILS